MRRPRTSIARSRPCGRSGCGTRPQAGHDEGGPGFRAASSLLRARRDYALARFWSVRMHDVQACTRRGLPSIMMVVFWTFGFQVRADLWFEWLTLWPKLTPL